MSWSVGAASALGTGLVRGEKTRRRRNAQKVPEGRRRRRQPGAQVVGAGPPEEPERDPRRWRRQRRCVRSEGPGARQREALRTAGRGWCEGARLWLGLRGRGQVPLSPSGHIWGPAHGLLFRRPLSQGRPVGRGEGCPGRRVREGRPLCAGERLRRRRRLTRLCWSSPRMCHASQREREGRRGEPRTRVCAPDRGRTQDPLIPGPSSNR